MKKYIQKIKDSINKSWNNKTSKTKRLIIYGLLLAYLGLHTQCLVSRITSCTSSVLSVLGKEVARLGISGLEGS